jgi:hypothetical protein
MATEPLDALARRLRVGVHSPGVCLACLSFVAMAHPDDERAIRREVAGIAGTLWIEGFGESVRGALDIAVRDGVEGAAEARRDFEARSCRSDIFRAVIRRLAVDLREHETRSYYASLN